MMTTNLLGKIGQFRWLQQLEGALQFALPMGSQQSSGSVVFSILLASFLINILALAFPLALLQIYDRIIPNQAITTLVILSIAIGATLIMNAVLRIIRTYIGAWADARFEHTTGCKAFGRLINSSMVKYEKLGTGIHLKRFNSLGTLRNFYSGQAMTTLVDLPFIFVYLVLIAYIAHWLVFVPIVILMFFLIVTLRHARALRAMLVTREKQEDRRLNFLIETLNNIHTVKSINMEAQMLRRYERLQKAVTLNDFGMSLESYKAVGQGMALSQLTVVLIVALGSVLVINGYLTIGGLAACSLLGGRTLQPVNSLIGFWNRLQQVKIARNELNNLLTISTEASSDLPVLANVRGDLELCDVSFRYKENGPDIIKNLSLKIAAKTTVGITGEGLSGKSTLLWLILMLLVPTEGRILIDGKDIIGFDPKSIRQNISYLPQQGVLFQGTIMDNLTMFHNDERYKMAKLVSERTGLAEVIEHLPQGYDTMVATQAMESLSRGIKQRITIARALIHDAPIVLFDEANTAVDMQGDAILKECLIELAESKTMVIISQRPSILDIAQVRYRLIKGGLEPID